MCVEKKPNEQYRFSEEGIKVLPILGRLKMKNVVFEEAFGMRLKLEKHI
jgi:hypothetical protein